MKRWCLSRGKRITSGWEECVKCSYYVTTLCPSFKPEVRVSINEFANWFELMKTKTEYSELDNQDCTGEVQTLEEKANV